jgi:hypothetical protein
MAILPPFIEFVILNYWSIIRTWLSERWYSQLLGRYQDHWLVKVKAVLDFGPFEQACAGFHLDNGWGVTDHLSGGAVGAGAAGEVSA